MNIADILVMISSTVVGAFGAFFFKRGADRLEFSIVALIKNYSIYLGALLYLVSNILFILPLRSNNLSIVYGFSGLYYVWTMLIGRYILGERITTRKIVGVALVVIGIVVISL